MPTLSASDYTQYLKFKAAAATPIRPAIQTRDNATVSQSVLNANILASQAAYVVNPSISSPALYSTETTTLSHTGADQTFIVPPTVTSMTVTLNGAGGETAASGTSPGEGGPGGLVSGVLPVSPGEVLTVVVGGKSGYGGGGAAGGTGAGSGGGRTAILRGASELATAGGGGGGGRTTQGGYGGGSIGGSGSAFGGLSNPRGLAMDSQGNLFVANSDRHTIMKVTSDGVISVFAGTDGVSGSTNATGTSASFNDPQGLAIDENDNLYVVDRGNFVVRKITPGAVVTTLAGTQGTSGTADGAPGVGQFGTSMTQMVYDGSGTLYVLERNIFVIRSVSTSTGNLSTFKTLSHSLTGIAIDVNKNLYVGASNGGASAGYIQKITTPDGIVTTVAGSSSQGGNINGDGTTARFRATGPVATDGVYLYVVDMSSIFIKRMTLASPYTVTTYAGSGTLGWTNGTSLLTARIASGTNAMTYARGALFTADFYGLIRRFTSTGVTDYVKDATGGTQTAVGTGGSGAGAASGTTGGAGKTGDQAGGGGGGYFGGGGATTLAAGAGGSSYTGGLTGTIVDIQGGGSAPNTNGSVTLIYTYGFKNVQSVSPGKVNNPQKLSTVGYAGTSGALSSSRVQQPGGLPTGFKNSQGTYTRLPQNAGWSQGGAANVSSGPKRF